MSGNTPHIIIKDDTEKLHSSQLVVTLSLFSQTRRYLQKEYVVDKPIYQCFAFYISSLFCLFPFNFWGFSAKQIIQINKSFLFSRQETK